MEIEEGRLDCIDAHQEGKFHRGDQTESQKDLREQRDPFSKELHKVLDQTIVSADILLREKIGRGLPVEKYQYFNIS